MFYDPIHPPQAGNHGGEHWGTHSGTLSESQVKQRCICRLCKSLSSCDDPKSCDTLSWILFDLTKEGCCCTTEGYSVKMLIEELYQFDLRRYLYNLYPRQSILKIFSLCVRYYLVSKTRSSCFKTVLWLVHLCKRNKAAAWRIWNIYRALTSCLFNKIPRKFKQEEEYRGQ